MAGYGAVMATVGSSPFYSVAVSVRSVPSQCGVARLFLRGIFGRQVVEVPRNAELNCSIGCEAGHAVALCRPGRGLPRPSAGNLCETILRLHGSFALLFSPLFN